MTDETPVDLRSLADVDSPDEVHEALVRFRRRAISRYLWVVLAALLFGMAVVWGSTPTTLAERVDGADVAVNIERVWRVDGVNVALDRIADLGETKGLHFLVIPDRGGLGVGMSVTHSIATMQVGAWERYVEVDVEPGTFPTLKIRVQKQTTEIPLGGPGSGVPAGAWGVTP